MHLCTRCHLCKHIIRNVRYGRRATVSNSADTPYAARDALIRPTCLTISTFTPTWICSLLPPSVRITCFPPATCVASVSLQSFVPYSHTCRTPLLRYTAAADYDRLPGPLLGMGPGMYGGGGRGMWAGGRAGLGPRMWGSGSGGIGGFRI